MVEVPLYHPSNYLKLTPALSIATVFAEDIRWVELSRTEKEPNNSC
jgi:hypothetical protein